MAKTLEELAKNAKRKYDDVLITLDGTLAGQRDALKKAIVEAGRKHQRLATSAVKTATDALAAWDEEHADEIARVRIYACAGKDEWAKIRMENAAADGDPVSYKTLGYNPYNAAIDVIVKHATQVMDDGEERKPSAEFWQHYFGELVHPGDLETLAQTVMNVNGTPTGQAFEHRLKA